jgi:hypothetical protein
MFSVYQDDTLLGQVGSFNEVEYLIQRRSSWSFVGALKYDGFRIVQPDGSLYQLSPEASRSHKVGGWIKAGWMRQGKRK